MNRFSTIPNKNVKIMISRNSKTLILLVSCLCKCDSTRTSMVNQDFLAYKVTKVREVCATNTETIASVMRWTQHTEVREVVPF